MPKQEFLQTGEFAIGERPRATRMVGAVPGSSDTGSGRLAGVECLGKLIRAVNVVVGPVGGD